MFQFYETQGRAVALSTLTVTMFTNIRIRISILCDSTLGPNWIFGLSRILSGNGGSMSWGRGDAIIPKNRTKLQVRKEAEWTSQLCKWEILGPQTQQRELNHSSCESPVQISLIFKELSSRVKNSFPSS